MPMMRRLFVLVLVAAVASGCSSLSKVKTLFGGGKVKADAPAELVKLSSPIAVTKLWSTSLGDGEGHSWLRLHPALESNRVYAVDDGGNVLAIDASTGKDLWSANAVAVTGKRSKWLFWRHATAENGLTSSPGVGNGLVVVGGRNGDVVAFGADNGDKRWSAKVTSEVLGAPLVLSDRVIVRSNDGRVFGLDPADGSRKWVFDRGLPTLTLRGLAPPVAANGVVFIGYDDGTVVALREQDGLRVWEQPVAEPDGRSELDRVADVDGELQLGLDTLYAVSYHNQMTAMDPGNGRPLWNRDVGSASGVAMTADKVVVADKDGNVWALDRNSGNSMWKQDALLRRQLTSPVIQGDYVVVGDLDGYLHWINLSDGRIVGRERIQRAALRGTPQVSPDGVIFVETNEGKLAAYKLGG